MGISQQNIIVFSINVIGVLSLVRNNSGFFDEIARCKFTSYGKEYIGERDKTARGNLCQYWNTVKLDHFRITKYDFPGGNLTSVNNFCRNPNNSPDGPWCVVNSSNNYWEYCGIPFCHRDLYDCRDTPRGQEYSGKVNVSRFGKECLLWKSNIDFNTATYKIHKTSLDDLANFCRNLNNSDRPWCYVMDGNITTETCDVPLCQDLSQMEYFGKVDIFKELQGHMSVVHFKKLLDYVTVTVTLKQKHWKIEIQQRTSVWATDYQYECQKNIDEYQYCNLIRIFTVESKIKLIYVCNSPLKTVVILSPLEKSQYRLSMIVGPQYKVKNELNPKINQYKQKIARQKPQKYHNIPLLPNTGYFILVSENVIPYAVSSDDQVVMTISQIGRGYIGFVANENYFENKNRIHLKEFFFRITKKKRPKLIEVDEESISLLHDKINSNQSSNIIGVWNPHVEMLESSTEYLLSLVRDGLNLVIAIKPWAYDHYIEKLIKSNLNPFFVAAGLWPSLGTVQKQLRILRRCEFGSMPLVYLMDYAVVNLKQMIEVSESISSKLSLLPSRDNSLADLYQSLKTKIFHLFHKFIFFVRASTPCLNKPLLKTNIRKRKLINFYNKLLLYPMGNILVAPGVSFYPGTLDLRQTFVESVKLRLSMQFSNEVTHLGFYLPPGRTMELFAQFAKSSTCVFHVNFHLFDVWDNDSWNKWPQTRLDLTVKSREKLNVSHAFGGLLSMSCDTDRDSVELSLFGVVRIPMFDTRNSLVSNSWNTVSKNGIPWVVLSNDVAVYILPVISMRNIIDPSIIMGIWNFMIKQEYYLKGHQISKHRRELISADFQIITGYMHSGYPIGVLIHAVINPLNRDDYLLAEDEIRKNGSWGLLHEIGHNLQDSLFTFDGTEEVTNNIFTLVAMETFTGINSWSENQGWVGEDQVAKFVQFIKYGTFKFWKLNPLLALGVYAQLKNNFGWELFRLVFRRYNKLTKLQLKYNQSIADHEKIQLWITITSDYAKMNLCPLYELWRFPIGRVTKIILKKYPLFLPDDFVTRMTRERVHKLVLKYGGSGSIKRAPIKTVSEVGPLSKTSKIEGKITIEKLYVIEDGNETI